uniref:Uncharacterized protein n=1 Tax=Panagrolaimus sp. PS1159 TaxID=55785 RepID=A0AC35FXM2_9BILA
MAVNSPQIPPQLGYAQAASRNPRTRYHEEAETQFLRHSYINPPFFPGYPILKTVNSDGHRIPQPVPQGLINQLIAQHLALRERLGQTQKVPVIQVPERITPTMKHNVEIRETPFRRVPSSVTQTPAETSRILTYAEKRRRWKEEMKKKLKKQKVPPRQIVRPIITGEKNKYYVTYSPYYRLYQVSRQAPKGLNFTDNHSTTTTPQTELVATTFAPIEVISPEPPLTALPSSASRITTTTQIPSTTTTTTTTSIPKVVTLKVEPIQTLSAKGNKMQIRVAAIKPTSEAKGKQLLYMDDEDDEWKVIEEEDYYVDENGQPVEKLKQEISTTPSLLASTVITTTVDNGLAAIVFPVAHKTESLTATASAIPMTVTTRKPFEKGLLAFLTEKNFKRYWRKV